MFCLLCRFFFLSNDEMLEILSETKDPTKVQPHLKKCFEGIAELRFEGEDHDIVAMHSVEGEEVMFKDVISVAAANGAVEKWLLQVEGAMFDSIHHVTGEGLRTYHEKPREDWVLDGQAGMVVLVCTAVNWTMDVTKAITEGSTKQYEEKCTSDLMKIVDKVRGNISKLQRVTLGALVYSSIASSCTDTGSRSSVATCTPPLPTPASAARAPTSLANGVSSTSTPE